MSPKVMRGTASPMSEDQAARLRGFVRDVFAKTLTLTTVAAAVQHSLSCAGDLLRVAGHEYNLSDYAELCIVSMGKAGATIFDAVDALVPQGIARRAVISAPALPDVRREGVSYFQGGHPEPNADSMAAARAALDLLASAAPDALVLFLISGGASAMFELPIDDSISLADIASMNRLLVGCGASIAEINSVRKHLSRVKGGRLALAAGTRKKITLLISDVPDGKLDALGSGPSVPDSSTVGDCLSVLQRFDLFARLPDAIARCVERGLKETPHAQQQCFADAAAVLLLSNATFLHRLSEVLRDAGYSVLIDNSCDEWPYQEAAEYLLQKAQAARAENSRGCLLSGGELSVTLPAKPGNGGRNQQFALYCARQLDSAGMVVLSAGTDGIDGVSNAAGAVADSTTRARGLTFGLELEAHLRAFDAGPYFAALNDAIVIGPTGNNLRDVRMLLWDDQ